MKTILATLLLTFGTLVFGQDIHTTHCDASWCQSVATLPNGHNLYTTCNSDGCRQTSGDEGYPSHHLEGTRAELLLKFAFAGGTLDTAMLRAYLQEDDAALRETMQRDAWVRLW